MMAEVPAGHINLAGRVAVITGGNGGIGLGLARGVARAGANVAIWGRSESKNAAAQAELEGLGAKVLSLRCDVSAEDEVSRAFAETVEILGAVDAFFANAGITGSSPFVEMTFAEWRRVLSVNLDGTFLCLREAARHMVERGSGGSLVAVSSTAAIHGAPRQEHYGTSKTAVLGLIRGLAVELATHRVRCNALLPGWTDTDLLRESKTRRRFVENTTFRTPVKRWAIPEDFETVGAFLADPSITFHTGESMTVDGGYTIF
jgi:NAD(P)-dependent dehydrogenase (short-subunit alcohol dehydrogenase family)